MKLSILISILSIVLIAGCTIPDLGLGPAAGIGASLGLEIDSFSAEPSSVFSGSTVRLIMEVENKGGTTVENGDALIYLTGSNFDTWGGTQYEHFDRDMKSEDVVRGIPADKKRFAWSLTAPSLPAGQQRLDTFIGRVYHEYKTTAHGSIWVYSETEADAARAAGRQLYRPSFTYTKGPVGLQVSVSPDPVVLYGTETNFTLYIKVSNLAAGTIYYPDSVTYTKGSEDVKLTREQLNNVTITMGAPNLNTGSGCTGNQELIAGKETTLVCDLGVSSQPDTFKSYALNVSVSYGYYTERTATVTVQGR